MIMPEWKSILRTVVSHHDLLDYFHLFVCWNESLIEGGMFWNQLRCIMMRPFVNEDPCMGCGGCFSVCPADPKVVELREIEGKGRKSVMIHPEACDFGGACVSVCPTGAF